MEENDLSNINSHQKFDLLDNQIWQRSKVDSKGRCVLPQKLRKRLDLKENGQILWICVNRKNGKPNEFTIEVGIKK